MCLFVGVSEGGCVGGVVRSVFVVFCFFVVGLFVCIVGVVVFQMFLSVGNMGNFWKQFYFVMKYFKSRLCVDEILCIMHMNGKVVLRFGKCVYLPPL